MESDASVSGSICVSATIRETERGITTLGKVTGETGVPFRTHPYGLHENPLTVILDWLISQNLHHWRAGRASGPKPEKQAGKKGNRSRTRELGGWGIGLRIKTGDRESGLELGRYLRLRWRGSTVQRLGLLQDQFVRNVVFVNVTDILNCLLADILGHY